MRKIVAASLLLVFTVAPFAYGDEVTDRTSCAVMISAFDSEQPERIRPLSLYVLDAMDGMDDSHTEQGEPGIMAQLDDSGRAEMVAATSVHCRNYPKMTIHNSAAFVYRGIRELEIGFGTAK